MLQSPNKPHSRRGRCGASRRRPCGVPSRRRRRRWRGYRTPRSEAQALARVQDLTKEMQAAAAAGDYATALRLQCSVRHAEAEVEVCGSWWRTAETAASNTYRFSAGPGGVSPTAAHPVDVHSHHAEARDGTAQDTHADGVDRESRRMQQEQGQGSARATAREGAAREGTVAARTTRERPRGRARSRATHSVSPFAKKCGV